MTVVVQCGGCKTILGHTSGDLFERGDSFILKHLQSRHISFSKEKFSEHEGKFKKASCAFCPTKLGKLMMTHDVFMVEKSAILSYRVPEANAGPTFDEMKAFMDASMKSDLSKVKFTLLMLNDRLVSLEQTSQDDNSSRKHRSKNLDYHKTAKRQKENAQPSNYNLEVEEQKTKKTKSSVRSSSPCDDDSVAI